MWQLDHLAITARTLSEGVDWAEAVLGVPMAQGGAHPLMGTHNRLLALGDLYLEVIAVDPAAPPPATARWFDMDSFDGNPRLTNWIARCENISQALTVAPPGTGVPLALSRGDLAWEMAVPTDGKLPFDGAFPALICWQGAVHPVQRLPDRGCHLIRLEVGHPRADALTKALAGCLDDPRVIIARTAQKSLRALISTPSGDRWL